MDYYNIYQAENQKIYQAVLETINEMLIKGFNEQRKFEKLTENIGNYFSKIRNKNYHDFLHHNYPQSLRVFEKRENEYISEHADERIIKKELFESFNEENSLKSDIVAYNLFIEKIAGYSAIQNLENEFFQALNFLSITYDCKKSEYLNLDTVSTEWQGSLEYNIAYQKKFLSNDITSFQGSELTLEEEKEQEIWKYKIRLFSYEEKLLILNLYLKYKDHVKTPEFLKINMITGGLFDTSIFESNYGDKGYYKAVNLGIEYYKGDKLKMVNTLKNKLEDFKMINMKKALEQLTQHILSN